MIQFRSSKYITVLSLVFLSLLLTACQTEKEISEAFNCTDVQFSANSGIPMDRIEISAIPSFFEDLTSFIVTGTEDTESLLVTVDREVEGVGGSFYVPIHPSLKSSGGEVKMILVDKSENQCEAIPFTIDPLPKAPGAYREAVELLGELGQEQSRILGVSSQSLSSSVDQVANPFSTALRAIDHIVQGEDNVNSIKRIANHEAEAFSELSSETWEVLDGLVKRSEINSILAQNIADLKEMEAVSFNKIPRDSKLSGRGLVSISSMDVSRSACNTAWHIPDASTLNDLMNFQIKNEIFGSDTRLLDGSATLFGMAGVLSTAAGSAEGIQASAASGLLIMGMKLQYELFEGILPSEFVDLSVIVDPVMFLEDDVELNGHWEQAMVTAQSRGWTGDKFVFELLLNQLSGRVTDGMLKKFDLDVFGGTTATWKLVSGGLYGALTNELYGPEADRAGVFGIPPCKFGPTDISDEMWSTASIINEEQAPVYMQDHYNYQVRSTGEATLEVAPRGDRFGRRVFQTNGMFFSKDTVIHVLPIEVTVTPSEQRIEPGEAALFIAKVENANDGEILWDVDDYGAHTYYVDIEPDGTSVLTIHTSSDPNDFPVRVTAMSVSETGLRALPDAPPREAYGLLRSDQVEIEIWPETCCIEPGESQLFTAAIHGIANQDVIWHASNGSITPSGLFTAPESKLSEPIIVTATSAEEPAIKAEAKVLVRDCYCFHGLSIGGQQVIGESSFMSWKDEKAGGLLESMTFIFSDPSNDSSDFLTINFIGDGPQFGETGTFDVEVDGAMIDRNLSKFVAREYQTVMFGEGVPWDLFVNGEIVSLDVPPSASLTIHQFEQGPEAHMAKIEGRLQGEVMVLSHGEHEPYGANPERITVDLTFTEYYDLELGNGTINCFGDGW